jgi:mono/diheme cytochrome c family protein
MRGRSRVKAILTGTALLLVAVSLLGAVAVFARSEWLLRRRHHVALDPRSTPGPRADSAEGRRRAVLIGCLKGCHGPEGEGGEEDAPGIFSVTAPTLTAVLPDYSDAELVRLVRFGVKRDGTSAVGMPTTTFYPMSGEDLALIIGHLRARPPLPAVPRRRRVLPLGRLALLLGKWKISADQVDRSAPRWGELPRGTAFERGRYLASVTCSECHGLDYKGEAYFPSPSLAIVQGYFPEQFRRLLRTGEHLSGRTDGLMSRVARAAFAEFTDEEIDDLYAFLTTTFAGAGLATPAQR